MDRRLIPVVTIFLVLAAAGVCAAPLGGGLERGVIRVTGQSYVESIDILFNVRSGGCLSLGTSTGSVVVQTWSREQVRLVVTKRARADDAASARKILETFNVRARHGGADVRLEGRSMTPGSAVGVEFTLWVPKSYNLDIKTRSGTITLPEVDGKFSARTDDGRIVLDCETDDLDIEVEDHSGETAPSGDAPIREERQEPDPRSSYEVR